MNSALKIDAEKVMKRCQIGTTNYEDSNNLHAECYRTIGRLLAEVERLSKPQTVMAEYKPQTYAAYRVDGKMKIGVVPEDILKKEGGS